MIFGITGHQNLGDPAAVEWVRAALREQVARRPVRRGLSSLAIGADQLFVRVLQSVHVPFEAVIPCAGYETTFSDDGARTSFRSLLAAAASVHHLPFAAPTEEAFFAAGRWIVSHCDVLVAVWNGLPAKGLGGTGDVVAVAQASKRAWVHINTTERSITDHTART